MKLLTCEIERLASYGQLGIHCHENVNTRGITVWCSCIRTASFPRRAGNKSSVWISLGPVTTGRVDRIRWSPVTQCLRARSAFPAMRRGHQASRPPQVLVVVTTVAVRPRPDRAVVGVVRYKSGTGGI